MFDGFLKAVAGGWPVFRAQDHSKAIAEVMAERQRQIAAEGFTVEHDDKSSGHNLALAAAAYAMNGPYPMDDPPWFWPWDRKWWKPKDERRDLVRAAALIIARIEQIDRGRV
jgi:hypothetical protein